MKKSPLGDLGVIRLFRLSSLLKKLSDKVYITPEINEEFKTKLPDWIKVKKPKDKYYQEIIEFELDKGEASAITLSFEMENAVLILDDKIRKGIRRKTETELFRYFWSYPES